MGQKGVALPAAGVVVTAQREDIGESRERAKSFFSQGYVGHNVMQLAYSPAPALLGKKLSWSLLMLYQIELCSVVKKKFISMSHWVYPTLSCARELYCVRLFLAPACFVFHRQ